MQDYSPPWFFMSPGGGGRRRKWRRNDPPNPPQNYSMEDWIADMKAYLAFQEEQEKKRKADDEEKKKKEKKPPSVAESFLGFIQWWALMSIFGLPIGLVTLKLLNYLATEIVPAVVLNAVK